MSSWEQELREHFPAYLLPAAENVGLSRESAERFLDRLWGKQESLKLLLATSALAPAAALVREFSSLLPGIANALPSRTEVMRSDHEGHIRGRVDMPATLRKKLSGKQSLVVCRTPERQFDFPENVLLVATADRLASVLVQLEEQGLLVQDSRKGWSAGLRGVAEKIRHTLSSTVLREVPKTRIEPVHEQAARLAPQRVYHLALQLHNVLDIIETYDADSLIKTIAEGALSPLEEETRFEIAVLIRLGRSIEKLTGCKARRSIIERERSHVFEFCHGQDSIRIYYNKARFGKTGPRDRGINHYFGEKGSLRPDITIECFRDGNFIRSMIVEAKHSDKKEYLKAGYEQSLIYSFEYAYALVGWPKVALVVSSKDAIAGLPRREDDVVATSWDNWVPEVILDGLLDGLQISRGCCISHIV